MFALYFRFHVELLESNQNRFSANSAITHDSVKLILFFLSGLSFTDTDDSQDSRGREGTIFYSTLPLPPTHEHSENMKLITVKYIRNLRFGRKTNKDLVLEKSITSREALFLQLLGLFSVMILTCFRKIVHNLKITPQ